MEKRKNYSNKAMLIATVLIIAGGTAIFSSHADNKNNEPSYQNKSNFVQGRSNRAHRNPAFNKLNDEQKTQLKEVREFMRAGDTDSAKAVFDKLGIEMPERLKERVNYLNGLNPDQKEALQKAHQLFKDGKQDEAREVLSAAEIKRPAQRVRRSNRAHRNPAFNKLNDEQKTQLKEVREFMRAGDTDSAKAVFDKLGIEMPERLKERVNYLNGLNPDQKEALQKAHQLFKDGKQDEAREVLSAAEIKRPAKRAGRANRAHQNNSFNRGNKR